MATYNSLIAGRASYNMGYKRGRMECESMETKFRPERI